MALTSIDDLKATISRGNGLAAPNRFNVHMVPPRGIAADLHEFTILCENASFPGKQIATADYGLLRQTEKIPIGYLNEEVTFTFLLTNQYSMKAIFESWLSEVIDFNRYRVAYKTDYATTVKIEQLDRDNKVVYTVDLLEAFPITLSAIGFDNAAENAVQKMTVTMAFTDYKVS